MEPLVTNRRCLIWLYAYPADASTTRWQKLAHVAFAVFVLTVLIGHFASSFVFGWKYISIDVGKSVFAFMFCINEFFLISLMAAGMILLRKIGRIFDDLSTIYKASKYFPYVFSFSNFSHYNCIQIQMKKLSHFAFWYA